MNQLAFVGDDHVRRATVAGRWLDAVQLWRPSDSDQLTTGDVETAAVLLSGTFDLHGGSTAWPARGARPTPFQGRPMAVFLPPHTHFRADRGQGEILLVSARLPSARPAAEGRAAFAQKPLLPLAGSGKAFDPNSGEWLPAETFPDSPESLPPRRMQQLPVGACTVERVLAPEYKARTLSIDEVVLPAGESLHLAAVPGRPRGDELLVFVRSEAVTRLAGGGANAAAKGDAAFLVATPDGACDLTVAAEGGRSYVVFAYAGKTER